MRAWLAGCLLAAAALALPRVFEALALQAARVEVERAESGVARARARAAAADAAAEDARDRALALARERAGLGEPLSGLLSRMGAAAGAAGIEGLTFAVASTVPGSRFAADIEERSMVLSGSATPAALRKLVEELERQHLPVRIDALQWHRAPAQLHLSFAVLARPGANP